MANKPRFDGDFTITDVENISNQWDTCLFNNEKSTAFNGVAETQSDWRIAGPATTLSFGATGAAPEPKISFCAWIKPSIALATYFTIVSKSSTGPSEYIWFTTTLGTMFFFLRDGSAGKQIVAYEPGPTITLGQWNHVCVTYDGTSLAAGIKFYVNGTSTGVPGTGAPTIPPYAFMEPTAEDFIIGRLYTDPVLPTNKGALGLIDEVVAFKKELSAGEVTEIYNSGFIFDFNFFSGLADLVSWWRMGDKATGTSPDFTIPDQIGSNDAVMSNFLGDATSGVVEDAVPPLSAFCSTSPTSITQAGRGVPLSLATKGILFRNRSKPYVVSNGGNPDDIII